MLGESEERAGGGETEPLDGVDWCAPEAGVVLGPASCFFVVDRAARRVEKEEAGASCADGVTAAVDDSAVVDGAAALLASPLPGGTYAGIGENVWTTVIGTRLPVSLARSRPGGGEADFPGCDTLALAGGPSAGSVRAFRPPCGCPAVAAAAESSAASSSLAAAFPGSIFSS